jgi:hypothetical protein
MIIVEKEFPSDIKSKLFLLLNRFIKQILLSLTYHQVRLAKNQELKSVKYFISQYWNGYYVLKKYLRIPTA